MFPDWELTFLCRQKALLVKVSARICRVQWLFQEQNDDTWVRCNSSLSILTPPPHGWVLAIRNTETKLNAFTASDKIILVIVTFENLFSDSHRTRQRGSPSVHLLAVCGAWPGGWAPGSGRGQGGVQVSSKRKSPTQSGKLEKGGPKCRPTWDAWWQLLRSGNIRLVHSGISRAQASASTLSPPCRAGRWGLIGVVCPGLWVAVVEVRCQALWPAVPAYCTQGRHPRNVDGMGGSVMDTGGRKVLTEGTQLQLDKEWGHLLTSNHLTCFEFCTEWVYYF